MFRQHPSNAEAASRPRAGVSQVSPRRARPGIESFPPLTGTAKVILVATVKHPVVMGHFNIIRQRADGMERQFLCRAGRASAAAALLLLACPTLRAQPTNPAPSVTLTNFRQVLELTTGEARKHRPVESRAVVTLADPVAKILFFQDASAGIFAYGVESSERLRPGQIIDVRAVSEAGKFSPILSQVSLRLVGAGPLPPPRKTTLAEFTGGAFDSQWVELQGVVRSESAPGQRLKFDLGSGHDRVPVWVQQADTNRPSLVDCVVRVRGVGGVLFNSADRVTSFLLYVTSLDEVTVLDRPEEDVFNRPVTAARDLSTYAMRRNADRRIRVRGVVARISSSRKFCLRDESGHIHLQAAQPAEVRSGELVEAAGFTVLSEETPSLHEVIFRSLGQTTNALESPVSIGQLLDGRHEHEMVSIEGQLLQRHFSLKGVANLLLESGGQSFAACLPAAESSAFADLRPGSQLRVLGVAELDRSADPARPLASVWLRSSTGVKLLAPPPRQIHWLSLLTFGLPGLAGCAGLGWLICAQQRRWRQIQREFEESQRGLQDSLSARERMAQDLHDNVMQSVFAVGLGLEDCRRKLRAAPEAAEEQLNAAISALNASLREIRRFIGGLEPQAISGHEFKAALKSLALTIGDSAGQFAIDVHPTATSRLTTEQATQLLNIAKEAMSNSLRHAHASKTVVSLQPEHGTIRLEVADDGVGFNPSSVRDQTGLGLRNIESRARSLGARLQVISAPGRGARIIVELPQTKL